MAHPESPLKTATTTDSISAAELRRRLLATTPSPVSAVVDVTPSRSDTPARLRLPDPRPEFPMADEDTSARTPTPPSKRMPVVGLQFQKHEAADHGRSETGPELIRYADRENPTGDVQRLKSENKELRKLLEEMKGLLQDASDNEQQAATREKDIQVALTEKSQHVEELSTQLQLIEEQIASGVLAPAQPQVGPRNRTELEEWADDLEKESAKISQDRKHLDSERQQLREDEEALESQMREMEVAMARERALMARQEMELRRLSNDIQQELEMIQRGDSQLREQMQKFQRRAQDVMQGRDGGNARR